MITSRDKPDEGTRTLGPTVHLVKVDQSRDALDPNTTVREKVSCGAEVNIIRAVPGKRLVLAIARVAQDGQWSTQGT